MIDAAKRQLGTNRTTLHQLAAQSGFQLKREPDEAFSGFQSALAEWDGHVAAQNTGKATLLETQVIASPTRTPHCTKTNTHDTLCLLSQSSLISRDT